MNIYYTNNTLYVNLNNDVNELVIDKLKSRVFGILNDYDIENIVLNIIGQEDVVLLEEFINEYHKKYHGRIIIK